MPSAVRARCVSASTGQSLHFGNRVRIQQLAQIGLAKQSRNLILTRWSGPARGVGSGHRIVKEIANIAGRAAKRQKAKACRASPHAAHCRCRWRAAFQSSAGISNTSRRALAIGLQQQGNLGIARGHAGAGRRRLRTATAATRICALRLGHKQNARPAASRKRPRTAPLCLIWRSNQPHGLGRLHQKPICIGRLIGVGKGSTIRRRPTRVNRQGRPRPNARTHRHGPQGNMDAAAERR